VGGGNAKSSPFEKRWRGAVATTASTPSRWAGAENRLWSERVLQHRLAGWRRELES